MKSYSAGTIRKRRKSKYSSQWEWQGFISVTENGKRSQLTKMLGVPCDPPTPDEKGSRAQPTGKGAKSALDALKRWRDELVAQSAMPSNKTTNESVKQFLERYLATLEVEPGTMQNYKYLLNHIALLDCAISELDSQAVRDWVYEMEQKGIGAHMRNKAFNLLKYACNWGVADDALPKNPCGNVKAPKRPKHVPNPLDPSELPRVVGLLGALKHTKPEFADMALLALNTGMRRGELCALRWRDVEGYRDGSFEGCIHVNQAIAKKEGGGTYIKNCPKNGNRRDININESIRTILCRRRKALLEVVRDLPDCFVFATQAEPDQYFSPDYATKLWGMFVGMNGIVGVDGKPLRFHDLRDTFATSALVNDVPLVTVASILGHDNANTTQKHYAHFIPSKNQEAMDFMGELLNAS